MVTKNYKPLQRIVVNESGIMEINYFTFLNL